MEDKEDRDPRRCQFWLPRKRRFCAAMALPHLVYCGNHKPSELEIRLPCPIDPSHTILQAELETHSRKCPALIRLQRLEQMPYYCQEVNAGSDDENIVCPSPSQTNETAEDLNLACRGEIGEEAKRTWRRQPKFSDDALRGYCDSKIKRTIANSLSKQDFTALVKKVETAYDMHCKDKIDHAFQCPLACRKWVASELDRRIPFQEKHIIQQASLLGNMESFGLLQSHNTDSFVSSKRTIEGKHYSNLEPVYVEFGAGRGYLAHMLADSFKVKNIVLVERRSYKFKADRTLKQNTAVSLERLRIDRCKQTSRKGELPEPYFGKCPKNFESLDLGGVESLQGRRYVGLSKHLCGYATDLALRCCLANLKQGCGFSSMMESKDGLCTPFLNGIAIATCCHHLCQWRPYINKNFFRSLGFSKAEFYIVTWLTSWALSGEKEHLGGEDAWINSTSAPNDQSSFSLSMDPVNNETDKNKEDANRQDNLSKWVAQPAERVALGLKCKQLLDVARLYWLKQNSMEAKLVSYVPPLISPENKLLLAKCISE